MQFNLLGDLEIAHANRNLTPSAQKPRQLICLLLINTNALVRKGDLIDEIWRDEPPASAESILHTYIYTLRKKVFSADPSTRDLLATRTAGYIARVPPDDIDVFRFEKLVARGRDELAGDRPAEAAGTLAEALALWRGPALADVRGGWRLESHAARMEEARLRASELRVEAGLRCGRHREAIGELKLLTAAHPYHEGLHAQLMLALYRSDRVGEALEVYRRLYTVMHEELGIPPCRRLQDLHEAILRADPGLAAPVTAASPGP